MENKANRMIADYLSFNEITYSKRYAAILNKSGNWCNFLEESKIKSAINISEDSERTFNEINMVKSALFEIRFAYLIHQLGLTAEYEFSADPNKPKKGNQQKTIDFKIHAPKNINLLVEASSLRESKLQIEKTWTNDKLFGCYLDGDNDVNEYFKAQNVLIEKAEKFSVKIPKNPYNIILLDMRSSILKTSDIWDYHNILYGSKKLAPHLQRYTKDNALFPGIFDSTHPRNIELAHLHENIHYFGFVVENKYTPNELAIKINWFKNPNFKLLNLNEIFRAY